MLWQKLGLRKVSLFIQETSCSIEWLLPCFQIFNVWKVGSFTTVLQSLLLNQVSTIKSVSNFAWWDSDLIQWINSTKIKKVSLHVYWYHWDQGFLHSTSTIIFLIYHYLSLDFPNWPSHSQGIVNTFHGLWSICSILPLIFVKSKIKI